MCVGVLIHNVFPVVFKPSSLCIMSPRQSTEDIRMCFQCCCLIKQWLKTKQIHCPHQSSLRAKHLQEVANELPGFLLPLLDEVDALLLHLLDKLLALLLHIANLPLHFVHALLQVVFLLLVRTRCTKVRNCLTQFAKTIILHRGWRFPTLMKLTLSSLAVYPLCRLRLTYTS